MKSSDNYLLQVLEALDDLGLPNDTLVIRTADHGEMGLAHGGLRQKNFVCYEEAIRSRSFIRTRSFTQPHAHQAHWSRK